MKAVSVLKNDLFMLRHSGITLGTLELGELKTEVIRKSIHFLIALSPSMAAISRPFTLFLLMLGTVVYTLMESARLVGVEIPLISSLTTMASRSRDKGHFVLGPVTLGIGASLALLLYPDPAASIGIYALAFGDGLASLVGKLFGRIRPTFLLGKSLEGSVACFIAVFFAAYQVSGEYKTAFLAAASATVAEALPLKDYDNLVIPLAVGFMVYLTRL
ncbi:MAG: SEC59/DGK1/VTE5 family protein [Spirochaetaceae bacterium]|jgi:dolichol kinase|nr:SEC59/DGK1/VTE5 family protein [Spirochaetaceae bacterium]